MKNPQLAVAVVGGGVAGLAAAGALTAAGHRAVVYDKGRDVGGRISSRRHEGFEFDHGAQYFTARDPRVERAVADWIDAGVVREWAPRLAVIDQRGVTPKQGTGPRRYVAVPAMQGLARHLAAGLEVHRGVQVSALRPQSPGWRLAFADATEDRQAYDALVLALPPPQAERLLPQGAVLPDGMRRVQMEPCYAAMLGYAEPLDVPFDGAFVNDGPLSWICRNSAKPGRDGGEAWVLHGGPDFSRAMMELSRESALERLEAAFADLPGLSPPPAICRIAHRWRYAQPGGGDAAGALWDGGLRVAYAGDWCAGGKVGGAYVSGLEAAQRVVDAIAP